ncbi:MAG TPA: hypothetical protein VHE58_11265 [Burkholderiales bacterium]|nr:hypothetical protein [Burkholderiales bacterium]
MASAQDKTAVELAVFREFAEKARLSIDDTSIEKRGGESEPDILCKIIGEGPVSFELVEICDSTLAATIAHLRSGGVATGSTSDPSIEIIRRKLHKKYKTDLPIELLCYTNGRVVTTDDGILAAIRPWFDAIDGPFRRAWLLGEKDTYEVWRAS